MFNSLPPHELQHARLPCPLLSPGVCSNSSALSWWCHPIISFSVAPFSSCLQSFPASGSLPISWLFTSGSQTIGASASASASFLSMNIQDWFPLELTGLVFFLSKGLSTVFSSTTKASFLERSTFFMVQLSHLYMTTGKTIALSMTFCYYSFLPNNSISFTFGFVAINIFISLVFFWLCSTCSVVFSSSGPFLIYLSF